MGDKKKTIIFGAIILTVCLAILLITFLVGTGKKSDEDNTQKKVSLIDMSAEECFDALHKEGFNFPESFRSKSDEEKFKMLKEHVDYVIENNGGCPQYSFSEMAIFSFLVQRFVIRYEGLEDPYEGLECPYKEIEMYW